MVTCHVADHLGMYPTGIYYWLEKEGARPVFPGVVPVFAKLLDSMRTR